MEDKRPYRRFKKSVATVWTANLIKIAPSS